jgi:ubiquinone/menaquinone biosynthesis C-methylase UbiE
MSSDRKENINELFDKVATTYDMKGPRFFSYFGQKLVDFSQISMNIRVLDVATGRGAVLYPTLEKVGISGSVTGIDLSEEMRKKTTTELEAKKIDNARILRMDADSLAF